MTNFTSATFGEINTPINILREFLATFNRRQKCKAAILSWFDGKLYYKHEWVRVTFEDLADILGYCRATISRHIKELVFDGILDEQPSHCFPKDTASQYRLNLERIAPDVDSQRCEIFHTDVPIIPQVPAGNVATYKTNLSSLKENNTAVEETFIDDHEQEIEQEHEVIAPAAPTKAEVGQVCIELRTLRINPEPCLGVIKKYWGNVASAVARVKEAVNEGWCSNPTGLFINSCKTGEKPKNTVTSELSIWFNWARQQGIVSAISGGVTVYDNDGNPHDLKEMMQRYPQRLITNNQ